MNLRRKVSSNVLSIGYKEIKNKQRTDKAIKAVGESLIEKYKKEAMDEPKKKGIIKRTIHWL